MGGEKEAFREDGYANMLTKYGTSKDARENYVYVPDTFTTDAELAQIYSTNGLFAKIINHPAEMALKNGFKLGIGDPDVEDIVNKMLTKLKWKDNGVRAVRWSRLFGGSAILMNIDDGGDLDEPVNMDAVRSVDKLIVFERPEITPNYEALYTYTPNNMSFEKFGEPEYYNLNPTFSGTQILVHESRLLVFRNSEIPKTGMTNMEYKFFGIPEYNRIKNELRDTVTTYGNGYRLLERCVQAVYKMKDLSNLMATEEGEDKAIKRMQLIDMARSILNTMIIDRDGEEYSFQTFQLSGVKDIMDESCNLLSAVTNIPQTVLFGRSPAGENSTGESDLTNYYDYIEQIQNPNIVDNLTRLTEIILVAERNAGRIAEIPEYEVEADSLWNLSRKEEAELEQAEAQAELTKAQATQIYVDMQALDPREVRRNLAQTDKYQIDEIISEDDLGIDELLGNDAPEQGFGGNQEQQPNNSESLTSGIADNADGDGAAVLVIRDGRILCGTRKDNGMLCGPGGHIEDGENAQEAAIRESEEEFAITPKDLRFLGNIEAVEGCLPSAVFLCADIDGTPLCYNDEMENARWQSLEELSGQPLFPAFEESLNLLVGTLTGGER